MRKLTILGFAALVGCASSDPLGDRSEAVIGGDFDRETSAVVAVRREGAVEICSGVVVAARVVLTAGHCVWQSGRYFVAFGADARRPDAEREVVRVAPFPTATSSESDLYGGVDLAALELASDAPVAPMPVRASPLPATLTGARVDVIAVGRSEVSTTDSAPRRRVSLTISRVCSRLLRFGDETTNVCDGDSGGAVVYEGALVAIVSFGLAGCKSPSSHTRLDAHRPWVERVVAGRLDEPCPECLAPDASCDAPVSAWPEPPGDGDDGGCAWTAAAPPAALFASCLSAALATWAVRWRRRR
ncbi:MAG: trypsin-like serine protease [Deltaproteobacteria bacterium]|nr:trypsin-like serine protease [Deltaproteobacteria bacterium]